MRFIGFFLLGLLAIGCQNDLNRPKGQVFRYNESSNIVSLDPAFAREQSAIWAVNQIFNSLVEMDEALNIKPSLAKSWQVLDSGRVYVFSLRKEVLFSEDTCFGKQKTREVNSADVVFSLNRIKDPQTGSPGAWIMQNVDSIWHSNDSTIFIKLYKSFPPFLGMLSMKYASVVAPEAIEYYGKAFGEHPVGTGPFFLKAWRKNEKLVLRRNPNYWEKEQMESLPFLESVAISFVPDKQSSFLEFVKGNSDLLSGIDASYKDELLTPDGQLKPKYQQNYVLKRAPYLNTEYFAIVMDDTLSPVREKAIRLALNYCVDKEGMIKYLRNNLGIAASKGMIPKGLPGFDETAKYGFSYQPELARKILDTAGISLENSPLISLYTTSNYLDLCEYFQGQAKEVGLNVAVEVLPAPVFREKKSGGGMPFFRASWIADYPDAENYLSLFYSNNFAPNGPNYTHFSSPVFDSLYVQAMNIDSLAGRVKLYRKMDSILMVNPPVVPLYYDEVVRVYSKDIDGLSLNPLNLLDLRRVRKN